MIFEEFFRWWLLELNYIVKPVSEPTLPSTKLYYFDFKYNKDNDKLNNDYMKEKVLELLNKIATEDSKKESYKVERELCEILTSVIKKKEAVEELVGAYINNYPEKITGILSFGYNLSKLPDEIECYPDYSDYEDFKFETKWFDINYEEYFKELKTKQLNYKKNLIEKVENSLNKHKEEYEKLLKLEYKE